MTAPLDPPRDPRVSDEQLDRWIERTHEDSCRDNKANDGLLIALDLRDARAKLAEVTAERDDEREEKERFARRIVSLETECRCPACGCCTPEDADAAECGCDHPACMREGSLPEALEQAEERAERLRGALDRMSCVHVTNTEDGNYWRCRLCDGESPRARHVVPSWSDVAHATTCELAALAESSPQEVSLKRRSLRDELAFLLDSTVDLSPEQYDRDTLLMRLECAFLYRESSPPQPQEDPK